MAIKKKLYFSFLINIKINLIFFIKINSAVNKYLCVCIKILKIHNFNQFRTCM